MMVYTSNHNDWKKYGELLTTSRKVLRSNFPFSLLLQPSSTAIGEFHTQLVDHFLCLYFRSPRLEAEIKKQKFTRVIVSMNEATRKLSPQEPQADVKRCEEKFSSDVVVVVESERSEDRVRRRLFVVDLR